MKRIIYSAVMLIFISGTVLCQTSIKQNNAEFTPPDTPLTKTNYQVNDVYTYVEVMPRFKGGQDSLNKYISTHLKYPKEAQKANITGTVLVKFVVNKDGKVSDAEITKGIGYGCDEEALRVVAMMPDWNSGMQNHKNVRVFMTLPIRYKMK